MSQTLLSSACRCSIHSPSADRSRSKNAARILAPIAPVSGKIIVVERGQTGAGRAPERLSIRKSSTTDMRHCGFAGMIYSDEAADAPFAHVNRQCLNHLHTGAA